MPKQILSWQSKFSKFCRRTCFHILMFLVSLLKRNLLSYWKWKNFEEKNCPFMTSKNRDLFFIFVNKQIFFEEYVEMELKIIPIICEWFFEWQKQNIAMVTFKQAPITSRYKTPIKNYRSSTLCELIRLV